MVCEHPCYPSWHHTQTMFRVTIASGTVKAKTNYHPFHIRDSLFEPLDFVSILQFEEDS